MAKNNNQLGKALGAILVSSVLGAMMMSVAAFVMKDALYLIPAALLLVSGIVGVFVIRNLSRKLKR